jgi:DNA-binding transcriptional ArsR family regulator
VSFGVPPAVGSTGGSALVVDNAGRNPEPVAPSRRPGLIGDHLVTYYRGMADDDDRAFKALADPTRRYLLDVLFERDGRTLTELESRLEMTRFGVMKHLKVLEEAGLVVSRRSGREKLHFLNPVPIRLIHDRWIDKYTEARAAALADLKAELEGTTVSTRTINETATQVYRVYIKASAQAVWDALTRPEWSTKYGYGGLVSYDLRPGGEFSAKADERGMAGGMPLDLLVGEVLEADEPTRLVQTWHPVWSPDFAAEQATRLTFELRETDGITCLTVTHELTGAPLAEAMVGGRQEGAGGGWAEVLSDLKTLLETGTSLHA